MGRNRFARIGAGGCADQGREPFRIVLPASDIRQRADYRPDHIPQETVGPDSEYQIVSLFARISEQTDMIRDVVFPYGPVNGTDRSLVVPSFLLEAAEVMRSEKRACGLIHGCDVEAVSAMP